MKLLVASCYRPPNEDQTWLDKFNNFLGGFCSINANIILAGDFNLPQISWNSQETTAGDIENSFIEILNDSFLVQLKNTATGKDNILLGCRRHGDINNDWSNWKNTFLDAVSLPIPSTNIRSRNYVP